MIRPCKNKCGQMVCRKSQVHCDQCKKNKFWFVDIDEYNLNEDDPRKKLKKCECGHHYILWNQYQHTQSNHHKQYIIQRDNLSVTVEKTARMCTAKDDQNRIHGRWSTASHTVCPKCSKTKTITISSDQDIDAHISTKHADVYIFHRGKQQD